MLLDFSGSIKYFFRIFTNLLEVMTRFDMSQMKKFRGREYTLT